MRVNVAPGGQARLVMRQRGNQRLVLNANLWPEMKVTLMDGGKVPPPPPPPPPQRILESCV